jgi:phosphatidyl-myo-inositol dimannoside synthase
MAETAAGEGVTAAVPDVPRTLVVTNDFPPRVGGVQQYVWNVLRHLPPDRLAVVAPNWPGWADHDAAETYPVHRWPSTFLWPGGDLGRRVASLAREHAAEVVMITQGLPLGLLAPNLGARGLPSVVLTHGVEAWMARLPGTRGTLRRAIGAARAVTAVSGYTAGFIGEVTGGAFVSVLHPGVDASRFSPSVDGDEIRHRLGLTDRKVVLCVSRLIPRKGQDTLIRAMAVVRQVVPEAVLVLAGDGPYRATLEGLAAREAPRGSVVFTGAVADDELPAHYAACDVFAMPCRSRWGGLEVEGFGIVYLEAAATGKPVVAGHSGGAAEAIADDQTGLLVEGHEPKAVALALVRLLGHPELAARMGVAGRARIEAEFTWQRRSARLAELLRLAIA